jgi:lipopolysaccharide transport system permease protein
VVDGCSPFGYLDCMNMTSPPGRDAVKALLPETAISPENRITVTAARHWPGRIKAETNDIVGTAHLWRLVWTLSVLDIQQRYRGSILGPFWLTLSTGVMIGAMGFIYAGLFHINVHTYLPFLSLSLVLWNLMSAFTAEGSTCFLGSEGMIRAMRMPLSMHAARVVVRNYLVFAHNIVVIVVVFAIMRKLPGPYSFMIIPGFALWTVDAFAISLLLGVFCARFRDIPPIVASIMQIAFFVTPIIWSPTILLHRGIGKVLITWNPFAALLGIIRDPLLGSPLELMTWLVALGYSAVLIVAAGVLFAIARPRIAYWV